MNRNLMVAVVFIIVAAGSFFYMRVATAAAGPRAGWRQPDRGTR